MENNMQNGFIKFLIILILALVVLSIMGVDFQSMVESPKVQKNYIYVKETAISLWERLLEKPLQYFWQNIVVNFMGEIGNIEDLYKSELNVQPQVQLTPELPDTGDSETLDGFERPWELQPTF